MVTNQVTERSQRNFIPYSKGLSETSQTLECQYSFQDADHTQTKVKGKLDKHDGKGVVYSIPCECGSLYIGETGHTLKKRLMEHKWSVRNGDTNNGIAVHVRETEHSVQWEQAAVIKRNLSPNRLSRRPGQLEQQTTT